MPLESREKVRVPDRPEAADGPASANQRYGSLVTRGGLPVTEARALVVKMLCEHGERHMSTEQLCAAMVRGQAVCAISTFKTAIYDLANAGVLSRVFVPLKSRMLTFYEVNDQPPHLHLYCKQCRTILEIRDQRLEHRIAEQFVRAGLKRANFDYARAGTCGTCESYVPTPLPA